MARKSNKPTLDEIRRAAAGRWKDVIMRLTSASAELLDNRKHPCPQCGGVDRFNVYRDFADTGGMRCNKCFADRNQDGFAAVQWLTGCTFPESLQMVAEQVGLAKSNGMPRVDPARDLQFIEWNERLVELWCMKNPPIKPAAIQAVGGRLAVYRQQWRVIAIPIRNQHDKTCGWCMYNLNGDLPRFERGQIAQWVKVKNTFGSQSGVIRLSRP